MLKNTHLSLEGIEQQLNSPLAVEMENALKRVRKNKRVARANLEEVNISKIISKYTGLSIRVNVVPGNAAYVLVPDVNRNNPIVNKAIRAMGSNMDSGRLLQDAQFLEGTVNLSAGKVSGDFSKIFTTMFIGESLLWASSKFTVAETVAIMLHEIGHVFVYMEMLGRCTRTNYVLEEGTKRMLNASTPEQRIRILEDVEEFYGEDIEGKDKLVAQARRPDVYRTVFLTVAAQESVSQLGENIYDARAFEQLADQFAARHGYGRSLATALDKHYRAVGDKAYRPTSLHTLLNLMKFLAFTSLATFSVVGWMIPLMLGNPLSQAYDKPQRRIEKIRQQVSTALKDRDIDPEERKALLEDVKLIDAALVNIKEHNDVYEYIWKTAFPWGRKQQSMIKVQEDLEKMMNNRLYEAAATLKV